MMYIVVQPSRPDMQTGWRRDGCTTTTTTLHHPENRSKAATAEKRKHPAMVVADMLLLKGTQPMQEMAIYTIAARVVRLRAGQSTFAYCFEALFPSLRHCSFIVDAWRPEDLQPSQRELLGRYRVAGVDVGRRIIDIYTGKRFLPTFAFAVPASFGRVFAFAAPPDDAILRASTDGYEIDSGKLAAVAVASFVAFEGTWTFATPEPEWVEVLRAGLPGGAELVSTPASLNFVERPG